MAMNLTKRAIFLDKDGTLIENVPYNVDPAFIRLADGAPEGVRILADAGFSLYVVTNQSGVARGYFPEDALRPVEEKISDLMNAVGVPLAGFFYCPHFPQALVDGYGFECECRKPQPGLVLRAAGRDGIDLEASWLIGDILSDIECGNRAGCRTVLLDNGNETEWVLPAICEPDYVATDLAQAAEIILAAEGRSTAIPEKAGAKYEARP